jgi:hypothetical protein
MMERAAASAARPRVATSPLQPGASDPRRRPRRIHLRPPRHCRA